MNNDYEELKEYLSELEEEEWNRETKLYWLGRFDQRLELGVINIEEYQDLLKVARITDEDIFSVFAFPRGILSFKDWQEGLRKLTQYQIKTHYKFYLIGRLDTLDEFNVIDHKQWLSEWKKFPFTEKELERING